MNKREVLVGMGCFILGTIITIAFFKSELNTNKKLTSRILSNAIGAMKASHSLAESCSDAYNTVTACVSDLKTCDIEVEAKKLDEFNTRRKHADEQIDWMNKDMEKIIEEVSANR